MIQRLKKTNVRKSNADVYEGNGIDGRKQYDSGEVKMIPGQMCEMRCRRQLCQTYKENSVIRRFYENR